MRAAPDVAAIVLIGDGVVGALTPAQHVRRYEAGPVWWRTTMRWFAAHPSYTRRLAIMEAILGVLLTLYLGRRGR